MSLCLSPSPSLLLLLFLSLSPSYNSPSSQYVSPEAQGQGLCSLQVKFRACLCCDFEKILAPLWALLSPCANQRY